jgi:hypothetical protein
MKIHLHIERLVLDGLPVTSHTAVPLKVAVEQELAQSLKHGGLSHELRGGVALPNLSAAMVLTPSDKPRDLGCKIARAIYGDLGTKGTAAPNPCARRSLRGTPL